MGNQLQPVQNSLVVLFEKHATATTGLVLIGLVQFGFRSFFSPMDQTYKHYTHLHIVYKNKRLKNVFNNNKKYGYL